MIPLDTSRIIYQQSVFLDVCLLTGTRINFWLYTDLFDNRRLILS